MVFEKAKTTPNLGCSVPASTDAAQTVLFHLGAAGGRRGYADPPLDHRRACAPGARPRQRAARSAPALLVICPLLVAG